VIVFQVVPLSFEYLKILFLFAVMFGMELYVSNDNKAASYFLVLSSMSES
jgi:hypothetical protein